MGGRAGSRASGAEWPPVAEKGSKAANEKRSSGSGEAQEVGEERAA